MDTDHLDSIALGQCMLFQMPIVQYASQTLQQIMGIEQNFPAGMVPGYQRRFDANAFLDLPVTAEEVQQMRTGDRRGIGMDQSVGGGVPILWRESGLGPTMQTQCQEYCHECAMQAQHAQRAVMEHTTIYPQYDYIAQGQEISQRPAKAAKTCTYAEHEYNKDNDYGYDQFYGHGLQQEYGGQYQQDRSYDYNQGSLWQDAAMPLMQSIENADNWVQQHYAQYLDPVPAFPDKRQKRPSFSCPPQFQYGMDQTAGTNDSLPPVLRQNGARSSSLLVDPTTLQPLFPPSQLEIGPLFSHTGHATNFDALSDWSESAEAQKIKRRAVSHDSHETRYRPDVIQQLVQSALARPDQGSSYAALKPTTAQHTVQSAIARPANRTFTVAREPKPVQKSSQPPTARPALVEKSRNALMTTQAALDSEKAMRVAGAGYATAAYTSTRRRDEERKNRKPRRYGGRDFGLGVL